MKIAKGNRKKSVLRVFSVMLCSVCISVFTLGQADLPEIEAAVSSAPKEIVVYFPNWSILCDARHNMSVGMIPWDKITAVKHAFFSVSPNFELQTFDHYVDFDRWGPNSEGWEPGDLRGHFAEYKHYTALHPDVDVLVSVGGWTLSGYFHHMALTAKSRAIFINSVVGFLHQYSFIDGIDINWEFPGASGIGNPYGPEDKENYTALIRELRTAFNERGLSDRMLTVAMPVGYTKMALQEPDKIHHYLDWISVMTYDIHGAWGNTTNHHAPIFPNPNDPSPTSPVDIRNRSNADFAMRHLRDYYGIPAQKLLIGSPFYSRGWKNVDPNTGINGLFATARGAPVGNLDDPLAPGGVNSFARMRELENTPGYEKFRDPYSLVPWLFNRTTGVMHTYEDEISAAARADYVLEHGFGGVMIWEISIDNVPGGFPLLTVFYDKLISERAAPGPGH